MIEIIGLIALILVIYVGSQWMRAHLKLRRYKKMLATITHEEVQERAKRFKYAKKDALAGATPPVLRAWDEIFAEKRSEWGYK